jgi:hypothetical protein
MWLLLMAVGGSSNICVVWASAGLTSSCKSESDQCDQEAAQHGGQCGGAVQAYSWCQCSNPTEVSHHNCSASESFKIDLDPPSSACFLEGEIDYDFSCKVFAGHCQRKWFHPGL